MVSGFSYFSDVGENGVSTDLPITKAKLLPTCRLYEQ
jgi:hypothetical protein